MFVLARAVFRSARPLTVRTNTTLAPSVPSSSKVPLGDALESSTKGRRKVSLKRPDISLSKPKAWNTPLAPGVIPAYDLALEVLKKDCEGLKAEISDLKKRIEEEEQRYKELVAVEGSMEEGETGEAYTVDLELEKMRQRLHILEVQSEVNLPDVRWKVANAMADMSVPSHRHLVEQKWRKDGDLDLLMERIYQMKVVPDVLPSIRPSLDLHLVTPPVTKSGQLAFALQNIEPGVFLVPKQTKKPPRLFANVFHTDTRLYTLLLVDPDVPDESTASYTTYLHWMQPNIPLSATHTSQILDLDQHTKYLPPHPQKGTPYHRYTVLLLPQPPLQPNTHSYTRNIEARAEPGVPTSQHLDIPVVPDNERLGFNVREFCKTWGLDAKKGGGVHMFREVWDEEVSKIYRDVLGQEEPTYGRQPKYDHYEELKYRKKYIA